MSPLPAAEELKTVREVLPSTVQCVSPSARITAAAIPSPATAWLVLSPSLQISKWLAAPS